MGHTRILTILPITHNLFRNANGVSLALFRTETINVKGDWR